MCWASVVNLSPVGSTLNGLGGAVTGGSSHLTLIGGVTSDSYIYNINNGNPGGLLGLLLPTDSPEWAAKCLDIALADISCWAVNAAQDYQVLMGDGAFANGSKEVVIGANARHELPRVDANVAFPGDGVNDPTNPTGVPTADYAARMGHSVIVGDSAVGTANGQTLLGAEATSNQANSVALGYRSAALRGRSQPALMASLHRRSRPAKYRWAPPVAASARSPTWLAGSVNTDAVNVAQLKGAISLIDDVAAAVTYDLDGAGNPNYRRVTLGAGTGTTTTATWPAARSPRAAWKQSTVANWLRPTPPSPASSVAAPRSIRPAVPSLRRCSRSARSPPPAPSPRACTPTPPMPSRRWMVRWSTSTRRSPISATAVPSTCG